MMVKSERREACAGPEAESPTKGAESECSLEWPDSEAEDTTGGVKDKGRRASRTRRTGRARSPSQVKHMVTCQGLKRHEQSVGLSAHLQI